MLNFKKTWRLLSSLKAIEKQKVLFETYTFWLQKAVRTISLPDNGLLGAYAL
jgi:hypothetical protein